MSWHRGSRGVPTKRNPIRLFALTLCLMGSSAAPAQVEAGFCRQGWSVPFNGPAAWADLLGDLRTKQLSHACLEVILAWDRLSTVEGTPREDVIPDRSVAAADTGIDGGDPGLVAALERAASLSAPK